MYMYNYIIFGQLSVKNCVNYEQCLNSLWTALVHTNYFSPKYRLTLFWCSISPQTSKINSSIFGHRCKQWGQIDNSETGKSAIKLTEYNQPDPKESHSF